jgi:asparagine synthetase B (glutamine-hydrolysing)
MLPPLADLFAVSDPDPGFLDRLQERLSASGEFEVVWRPAPGWVAAQAPLPDSEPDGQAVHSRGFAFVEGRDRVEGFGGDAWLERLADITDSPTRSLAQVPGDFGFLHFGTDGSALAVRSCGGLVPLYLHRGGRDRVAIGTRLNYFPRFLPTHFRPDPLINASWERSALHFIDGRTFVEGVSILPRASHTELRGDRETQTQIYWDPRPGEGEEPDPDPEHPRELRRILIDALTRGLDPGGGNLLMLSGGVDSSSLGALAAGTLGQQLSSWSMIPPSDPERARELSYIEPLVSSFGIEPAHLYEFTKERHLRWIETAPGLPFQVLHPALCDLPNVCSRQDVRVLVSGTFADEVCGHVQRLNDWALHTSIWGLVRGPLPFGPRNYVGWARRRLRELVGRPQIPAIELPEWSLPEVQAEYDEWINRHRAALARDHRPLRELAARTSADAWVAMYWEGAAPLGVRPLLPFFSREALELAFRCHPCELLGPGPKRLLREALREDVPAHNLLRPDPGAWSGHFNGRWRMEEALPAAAAGVVRPDWFPHPPTDMHFSDGSLLAYSVRVAQYLERVNRSQSG